VFVARLGRICVATSIVVSGLSLCESGPSPAERADPVFTDVTAQSGIVYRNVCGAAPHDKGWINEYMGSGAAWLDYDGDGHLDLYLVNGSTHDRSPLHGEPNQLYRGDGRGRFTDVTARSGTGDRGWGYGVAVGDIDNDGDPDMYVTNLGRNTLYLNRGNGTFEDVTDKAGVGHGSWSTSAAFFDMERDGDLDLYVGHYVDFVLEKVPRRGSKRARPPFCVFRGFEVFCGPRGLPPAQNVMFRNNGDGSFTDVTEQAGMRLERPRYTLGVVAADFDNDGDQDVYSANDSVVNSLWRNRGDGTFEDVGLATLSALDAAGNPQGCMGVDAADYNNDGWLDLVVTNFSHDLNTLYKNVSGKFFVDESSAVGMIATVMALSWGTAFHDFDHDADLDLFIANGHAYPEVDAEGIGTTWFQQNHLFVNDDGKFRELVARPGTGLAVERSWRGTAFGDYDADGDVDMLVTSIDGPVQLLRNDTPTRGHFLKIRLEGTTSNRDAVGARVSVTADGKTQIRERKGGGSYLSASDPDLHVGLGSATRAELVKIRWPSGAETELRDVPADQWLTVRQK
jgi:hypothetical protein